MPLINTYTYEKRSNLKKTKNDINLETSLPTQAFCSQTHGTADI